MRIVNYTFFCFYVSFCLSGLISIVARTFFIGLLLEKRRLYGATFYLGYFLVSFKFHAGIFSLVRHFVPYAQRMELITVAFEVRRSHCTVTARKYNYDFLNFQKNRKEYYFRNNWYNYIILSWFMINILKNIKLPINILQNMYNEPTDFAPL